MRHFSADLDRPLAAPGNESDSRRIHVAGPHRLLQARSSERQLPEGVPEAVTQFIGEPPALQIGRFKELSSQGVALGHIDCEAQQRRPTVHLNRSMGQLDVDH